MPQLPSGKHIALHDGSLRGLYQAVGDGLGVHELMAITEADHLWRFIDVIYYRDRGAMAYRDAAPAAGSLPAPPGLEPYPSGYTVAGIGDELRSWPLQDQEAFAEFLVSERTSGYLRSLLDQVTAMQKDVLEHGNLLQRTQAGWWVAGVHPLQPGVDDDADDVL